MADLNLPGVCWKGDETQAAKISMGCQQQLRDTAIEWASQG